VSETPDIMKSRTFLPPPLRKPPDWRRARDRLELDILTPKSKAI
jgi:hypothetical protein